MESDGKIVEKDFSIVLGGPFFQLLRRARLTGQALELVRARVITITLVAWLPLFLLSLLNGQSWGSRSSLPFISDLDVHVRFLIALPLMIIAERMVHQRMLTMVKQFQERNLIPEPAVLQFRQAIDAAYRLRNSYAAEIIMVLIIYVIGYRVLWQESTVIEATTWYTEPSPRGELSLAGTWFRYVSLPLFQFLFIRWYYRVFIWARFLFQIARIKMRLVPSHPDGVGGLGFLSNSVYAFIPLAVAHGVLLSGLIANHIVHEGAALTDFKVLIIVVLVLVLCLVLVPLLAFSSQLGDVKREGSLEYGKFAARYVQEFEANRLHGSASIDDMRTGSSIQSLADLANSYRVVENMRLVPLTKSAVVALLAATLVPVLPLVLTMMPLAELIKMLSGVLF